jgi:hypothetical protein
MLWGDDPDRAVGQQGHGHEQEVAQPRDVDGGAKGRAERPARVEGGLGPGRLEHVHHQRHDGAGGDERAELVLEELQHIQRLLERGGQDGAGAVLQRGRGPR